ncbi:MAG: tRNA (adenine(9)-N1)-methyltransferase Trm10 [Pyrobaculum sp.]
MGLEPLWKFVFKQIKERGVDSICLPKRLKCKWDLPQCVALWLIVGRYRLCPGEGVGDVAGEWGGVRLVYRQGGHVCRWRLEKRCPTPLSIEEPPGGPVFIIDLSLWGEHTEGEKHELVEQILTSLYVVRSVWWDGALWITNTPEEFIRLFQLHARGLVHRVNIRRDFPPLRNPVVLDPEGDCVFTEETAAAHSEFIIGGIIDKERTAKSATKRLAQLLGVEKRCRIELRGSVVGVPDRINKIVEIVLYTLMGNSLEKSILRAQAKRDRVYRLMWEIQKRSTRRPDGTLAISREALNEANWLGASEEEVLTALKKVKAVVT